MLRLLNCIAVLSLCFSATAAPLPEFSELALVRVEERYDDSLDVAAHPLYRCGEVVRLVSNPEQLAVIWDYRFDGREWRYTVRRAHYSK